MFTLFKWVHTLPLEKIEPAVRETPTETEFADPRRAYKLTRLEHSKHGEKHGSNNPRVKHSKHGEKLGVYC
jgi:hypothetical protein